MKSFIIGIHESTFYLPCALAIEKKLFKNFFAKILKCQPISISFPSNLGKILSNVTMGRAGFFILKVVYLTNGVEHTFIVSDSWDYTG